MEPITREEMYLAAAAGYAVTPPEPITRKETFLAKLAGMDVATPAAYTRQELFIEAAAVAQNACVIEPLEITENGTYEAPEGVDGYSPVTVNVPDPEINLQDKTITENGTYTADDGFDGLGAVFVNIASSGGTLVCKKGTFTGNGSQVVVSHGLGTVPCFAYCYKSTGLGSTTDGILLLGLGFSTELTGITSDQQYGVYWNGYVSKVAQTAPDYPIDTTNTSSSLINNANETSVTFGSGGYKVESGTIYNYVVLGIKTE